MKYINKILFLGIFLISMMSCQKELEVGGTSAMLLSGDWVVTEYGLDGEALYGPYTIQIYNTSFSTDSIWINNIYDNGVLVKAKMASPTTFQATNVVDVAGKHVGTIEIKEAAIYNNDSIAFRVVLYNAAGEIDDDYYEAGHRYTGWPEDQH